MQDLLHAIGFILSFGLIFLIIIALEALYWHRKGRRDHYRLDETLSSITTGALYKVVDGIAIALFIQFFYESIMPYGLELKFEAGWTAWLALFLATDFFFYFYHVAMHKVRWFWSAHVTHHSALNMTFATALRQNFLIDLNFGWILWWIPLALIGFEKDWVIIAIELNLVYQFFLHTEVVQRLGWLEYLFNTPSHHRVHHGSQPLQIDRNFGGVLIIWDRLFRTFRDERDVGPIRYGLTFNQPVTLNPLRLNLDEFIQMFRDAIQLNSLAVFWKSPNWSREALLRQARASSADSLYRADSPDSSESSESSESSGSSDQSAQVRLPGV